MRNSDCVSYNECLTQAALVNAPMECDHCSRFKRRPINEEEIQGDLDGIFNLWAAVFSREDHAGAVPG